MMKNFCTAIIFSSIFVFSMANAQVVANTKGERLLTFVGLGFSTGINKVNYKDFRSSTDTYKESDEKSTSLMPTIFTSLYGNNILGEFQIAFNKESSSEKALAHYNLYFSACLKYLYNFNSLIAVNVGPGIYAETLPSSKSYKGGGILFGAGVNFSLSENWKIILNITTSYGSYGVGDDSTKFGYAAFFGIAKKFGRF